VKQGAATIRQPKAVYGGQARDRPDVTHVLIGINAVVFVLTTLTGTGVLNGDRPSGLFRKLSMEPYAIALDDQFYRLLTSTFLHFGIVHIALNMYCLYLLGPTLERSLGRLRFTALYLISGVSGAALSYAFGTPFKIAAGASGAVFGLFAAFYVITRKRGDDTSQIASTIAINLAFSFVFSGFIDWRGHVGGLIGGALVALALVYAPAGKERWLYQLTGCFAVLVLVAGLIGWRTTELQNPAQPGVSGVVEGEACPHCGDLLGRTTRV
jgi:membrane associated rhomboid family serine protease